MELKDEFKPLFETKDLGPVAITLRVEITRDRTNRKLFNSKKEFKEHVPSRFGMDQIRPITIPMEQQKSVFISEQSNDALVDICYRRSIVSLVYIGTDSQLTLGKLSIHPGNPLQTH